MLLEHEFELLLKSFFEGTRQNIRGNFESERRPNPRRDKAVFVIERKRLCYHLEMIRKPRGKRRDPARLRP